MHAHELPPAHAHRYTLDQDLALGVPPLPPLNRILKGICCRQIRSIVEDMQAEAARMHAGKPTLRPWQEVAGKEIGVS